MDSNGSFVVEVAPPLYQRCAPLSLNSKDRGLRRGINQIDELMFCLKECSKLYSYNLDCYITKDWRMNQIKDCFAMRFVLSTYFFLYISEAVL